MYEPFSTEVRQRGATTEIALAGELDVATVPEVRELLRRSWDDGATRLIVDLRKLAFIDSTGLSLFLGLDRDARRDGHEVVFYHGTEPVRRAFELIGLTDRLTFLDDPDEPEDGGESEDPGEPAGA